jgi:hypothetical protein
MAGDWAKSYQPVVYDWFLEGVESFPSLIPQLFDVQTSKNLYEYSVGVGGVPVEMWDGYRLRGQTESIDLERGYAKTFTATEYTVRFPVKILYLETDQTGIIRQGLNEIGVSAAQKKETDAAGIFNYSFTNSAPYLGPDGTALCYASHPVGPDNTGTTKDNVGADAFSYTAMKSARTAMREWVDGQNNPYLANGKVALIPIQLGHTAIEIFNASQTPGGVTYGGNAVAGFQYLEWDFLTDDESWWLIDPLRIKKCLKWYNYSDLQVKVVEETTTDIVYEFKMVYSYGWRHWSFVYGNAV